MKMDFRQAERMGRLETEGRDRAALKVARLASRAYSVSLSDETWTDRALSYPVRVERACSPISNTVLVGTVEPVVDLRAKVFLNGEAALRVQEERLDDWTGLPAAVRFLYRVEFALWTVRSGENRIDLSAVGGRPVCMKLLALFLEENPYPVLPEEQRRLDLRAELGIRAVMELQEEIANVRERRTPSATVRLLELVREDGFCVPVVERVPDDVLPSTRPALYVTRHEGAGLERDIDFLTYCEGLERAVYVVRPRPDDGSESAGAAGAEDVIVAGRYAAHRNAGRSVMMYFDDDTRRMTKLAMEAEWSVLYSPAPEDMIPPNR